MRHPPLFDEERAAQVAAYLLHRAGGQLNLLALTKLMYLAERLSLERHALPLTGDAPVSMQHGPVLSRTLDLTRGLVPDANGVWDAWIADLAGHVVALRNPGCLRDPATDLGALSLADIEVLQDTWNQFGHMASDPWGLVRYCHAHVHEWEDPGFSSTEIPLRRIFFALGYDDERAEAAVRGIQEQSALARAFR